MWCATASDLLWQSERPSVVEINGALRDAHEVQLYQRHLQASMSEETMTLQTQKHPQAAEAMPGYTALKHSTIVVVGLCEIAGGKPDP